MKKLAAVAEQVDRQKKLDALRAGAGAKKTSLRMSSTPPGAFARLDEEDEDDNEDSEDSNDEDSEISTTQKVPHNFRRTISELAEQDGEDNILDEERDGEAARHLFQSLDINNDGEVSVIEFMIGIRVVADRLGPAFAITAPMELFSNFEPGDDADDSGGITLEAFVSETFRLQHPTFNKIVRAVALDAGVECSPPEASTHHAVRSHKIVEFKTNSHTSLREHVRSSISRIATDMETYGLHAHVAEVAATRRASVRMVRRMSTLSIDRSEEGWEEDKEDKKKDKKEDKKEDKTGKETVEGGDPQQVDEGGSIVLAEGTAIVIGKDEVACAPTNASIDNNNTELERLRSQVVTLKNELERERAARVRENAATKAMVLPDESAKFELKRLRDQVSTSIKQIERQGREIHSLRMDRACMLSFCKEYVGSDALLNFAKLLRANQGV
jgi:hypothetical protein